MSSRMLRRMAGNSLAPPITPNTAVVKEDESEEEEEPVVHKPAKKNAFLALAAVEGNSSDSDEAEAIKNEEQEDDDVETAPPQSTDAKKKKKKKKNKKKDSHEPVPLSVQTKAERKKDTAEEEKIWASLTYVDLGPDVATATSATSKNYLAVEYRFLSAETEMKRIFGSHQSIKKERQHHGSKRPMRHAWFCTPQNTWPRMTERPGFTMDIDHEPNIKAPVGVKFFRFRHSQAYQAIQLRFLRAVNSYDHQYIADLLNAHPYHVDSLLQMSDVCKMGGDAAMAAELVSRSLFSLECGLHPLFTPATGNCRIDYNIYENRSFFLAMFRHIGFIASRGCWRTAFEVSKLLLSIEPDGDPLAAMLFIDYYALRSNQLDYLIGLFEDWNPQRHLDWLPNFAMSYSLALFLNAKDEIQTEAANTALVMALKRFPGMLIPLADKCGQHLPSSVADADFFTAEPVTTSERSLQALIILYVERSYSVWKAPEILEWLQQAAVQVISCVNSGGDALIRSSAERRKSHFSGMPRNIRRHILISECQAALQFLPQLSVPETLHSYDPLPPVESVNIYDERVRQGVGEQPSAIEMFFRSIMPGFNVERQAGAQPAFALNDLQRPMATLLQLAQSARAMFTAQPQLPQHEFDQEDEYLQDILAQFPDDDDDGNNHNDDDDEDDE